MKKASPQLENGYLKIANELVKALAAIRIPGEAMQILWIIICKTYGFNKKVDWIALSQFVEGTGISKPHVIRAVRKLVDMNIVAKKGNGKGVNYCLIKDYKSWKSLPKKATVAQKGNPSLPKKVPTKDNTTKDNKCPDKSEHYKFKIFYTDEYLKAFSVPYGFDGSTDGAIIKKLLSQFKSYDLLCQMVLLFFDSSNKFIKDELGYTIKAFKLKSNQLAHKVTSTNLALDKIKKEKSEPKKKKDGWGKPKFHGYK